MPSCVFTIDIEVMTWASIYTFDTADTYSNGLSDVVLGNVIKKLSLPRDEIVVMTKVYRVVGRTPSEKLSKPGVRPDELGYVNQRGLSRKIAYFRIKSVCNLIMLMLSCLSRPGVRLMIVLTTILSCSALDALLGRWHKTSSRRRSSGPCL